MRLASTGQGLRGEFIIFFHPALFGSLLTQGYVAVHAGAIGRTLRGNVRASLTPNPTLW